MGDRRRGRRLARRDGPCGPGRARNPAPRPRREPREVRSAEGRHGRGDGALPHLHGRRRAVRPRGAAVRGLARERPQLPRRRRGPGPDGLDLRLAPPALARRGEPRVLAPRAAPRHGRPLRHAVRAQGLPRRRRGRALPAAHRGRVRGRRRAPLRGAEVQPLDPADSGAPEDSTSRPRSASARTRPRCCATRSSCAASGTAASTRRRRSRGSRRRTTGSRRRRRRPRDGTRRRGAPRVRPRRARLGRRGPPVHDRDPGSRRSRGRGWLLRRDGPARRPPHGPRRACPPRARARRALSRPRPRHGADPRAGRRRAGGARHGLSADESAPGPRGPPRGRPRASHDRGARDGDRRGGRNRRRVPAAPERALSRGGPPRRREHGFLDHRTAGAHPPAKAGLEGLRAARARRRLGGSAVRAPPRGRGALLVPRSFSGTTISPA